MEAIWVFVPVLGAFLAHALVLRFDLLRFLKRPIDAGRTWRGRRLLGENKTWRGALVMFAGILVATLVLARWPAFWSRLPASVQAAGPASFGVLLGLGTVLAELPNSFIKRQLDVAPGAQRASAAGVALSLLDQGDFVLGAWLLLAPIWVMSIGQALAAFGAVVVVHLIVNLIGYAIGARTAPL